MSIAEQYFKESDLNFDSQKPIADYLCQLKEDDLFKEQVGNERVQQLCKNITYEFIAKGQNVFEQGCKGDKFYIILHGQVAVILNYQEKIPNHFCDEEDQFVNIETEVAQLSQGQSFGELALLQEQPRMATIKCKMDCHFAVLNKSDFKKYVGDMEQTKLITKTEFLGKLELFNQLSNRYLISLMYYFEKINCDRNQVIFKEKDESDKIYIIYQGEFLLSKQIIIDRNIGHNTNLKHFKQLDEELECMSLQKIKKLVKLALLGPGQICGEVDCMLQEKRKFTLTCNSDTGSVYYISRTSFLKTVIENDENPDVGLFINKFIKQRIQWYNQRVQTVYSTFFKQANLLAGIYDNKKIISYDKKLQPQLDAKMINTYDHAIIMNSPNNNASAEQAKLSDDQLNSSIYLTQDHSNLTLNDYQKQPRKSSSSLSPQFKSFNPDYSLQNIKIQNNSFCQIKKPSRKDSSINMTQDFYLSNDLSQDSLLASKILSKKYSNKTLEFGQSKILQTVNTLKQITLQQQTLSKNNHKQLQNLVKMKILQNLKTKKYADLFKDYQKKRCLTPNHINQNYANQASINLNHKTLDNIPKNINVQQQQTSSIMQNYKQNKKQSYITSHQQVFKVSKQNFDEQIKLNQWNKYIKSKQQVFDKFNQEKQIFRQLSVLTKDQINQLKEELPFYIKRKFGLQPRQINACDWRHEKKKNSKISYQKNSFQSMLHQSSIERLSFKELTDFQSKTILQEQQLTDSGIYLGNSIMNGNYISPKQQSSNSPNHQNRLSPKIKKSNQFIIVKDRSKSTLTQPQRQLMNIRAHVDFQRLHKIIGKANDAIQYENYDTKYKQKINDIKTINQQYQEIIQKQIDQPLFSKNTMKKK